MSTLLIARDVLILLFAALQIAIAIRLSQYAKQSHQQSLRWLSVWFISLSLASILSTYTVTIAPVEAVLGLIASLSLVTFVQRGFYQGRRSPYWVVVAVTLGLHLTACVIAVQYQSERALQDAGNLWKQLQIFPILDNPQYARALHLWLAMGYTEIPGYVIPWLWYLWAAVAAYRPIAADRAVEDWVKSRYQMMMLYCALAILGYLLLIGSHVSGLDALAPVIAIVALVMQWLVWMMPERFRQWLNRRYQPVVNQQQLEALTEDELLKRLSEGETLAGRH
jgi:hypothetical protein